MNALALHSFMKKFVFAGLTLALVLSGSLTAALPANAVTTDFVSTWDTTRTSQNGGDAPAGAAASSDDHSVRLPLVSSGTYNFTVSWGDGTSSTVTTHDDPDALHTYVNPGTYELTISGEIDGFAFRQSGDRLKLLNVSQWGSLALGNTGGYFDGAANFNSNASDTPDLTGTTDLSRTFAGASSFNGNINHWDVSNVTTLSSTFDGASSFNQPLSSWNVSNVTVMRATFYNASAFNQDLSGWNVSRVWHFGIMFEGASSFNQNLASWDIASGGVTAGSVTQMDGMFSRTAMSSANYSSMIVSWSSLTTTTPMFVNASGDNAPNEFAISAGYLGTDVVLAARADLVAKGWTIHDEGLFETLTQVGSSRQFTLTYTNASDAYTQLNNEPRTQEFSSITVEGDSATDFSVVSETCTTATGGLAVGESCTITFSFHPIFEGSRLVEFRLHEQGPPVLYQSITVEKFADSDCETRGFAGGDGSSGAPYLISTLAQLNCINAVDADGNQLFLRSNFKLTTDIDAGGSDDTFNPIGSYWYAFEGSFDGDGHTISNMTTKGIWTGFMPWISGGELKDLTFRNAHVTSDSDSGVVTSWVDTSSSISNVHVVGGTVTALLSGYFSTFAGFAENTTFSNVSTTAALVVSSTQPLTQPVGGLVSQADPGTVIENSFSAGSISLAGTHLDSDFAVGGLVGFFNGTSIENSYSISSISSETESSSLRIGGLVGGLNSGTLTNNYSAGAINSATGPVLGGFAGEGPADPADATLVGNFWDTESTGTSNDSLSSSGELTGLGSIELSTLSTFMDASWSISSERDASTTWFMPSGSYPVLAWQGALATNPIGGSGGAGGSGGSGQGGDSGSSGSSGSGGGSNSNTENVPSGSFRMGANIGQPIAGTTTTFIASGLQQSAPFEVVVRSTPQTLAAGNAVAGSVNTTVTMPSGLEAGWHSLTFSSTAADGSAYTQVLYFRVSKSGLLLETSTTAPAALALTGARSMGYSVVAGALLALGLTVLTLRLALRFRRTK